jgi:hypothetical protein
MRREAGAARRHGRCSSVLATLERTPTMNRLLAPLALLVLSAAPLGCAAAPGDDDVDASQAEDALSSDSPPSLDSFQPERCSGPALTSTQATAWVRAAESAHPNDRHRVDADSHKLVDFGSFYTRTRTCGADGTRCGPWSKTTRDYVDFEGYSLDTTTGESLDVIHAKGNQALTCTSSASCGPFGRTAACEALSTPEVHYPERSCVVGAAHPVRYTATVTRTCARIAATDWTVDEGGRRVEAQRVAYGPVNAP